MMNELSEQTPSEPEVAPLSFDDLALPDEVRRAIDEMGFVEPTPVQVAAFGPATKGVDLIVQARTGTGKTAAFGLPLVSGLIKPNDGPQALILAPTRELALQSAREIGRLGKNRGIKTAAVYGGAPIERQVRELQEGAQIVSGTPGRVLDHLKRGTLDGQSLRVLILDEADEMLSMGFAKELNSIVKLLPVKRQTMLFSATIDGAVERMSQRIMKDPERISLSSDAVGAMTVSHYYYLVSGMGKADDLIRVLENEDPESALIFCNTKVQTERAATALQQAGFDADWLNGDLPQSEREKVLGRTRKGELRYLVATDVAARGIDISHVTHVINFDFPENIEAYIHRTGRTGRAGRTGTAISLVTPPELGSLYYLRLSYKIFPVERSMPSRGELQTRREADRIGLLSSAFPEEPNDIDRAVARRLLTHPDAERLLGGLLRAFFGVAEEEDVDEGAAAARRDRRPAPVPEPEAPRRARAPERESRGSDRQRGAERPARREERAPRPESRQDVSPASAEEARSERPREERPREERPREERPSEARPSETRPSETRPSEARPSEASEARPPEASARDAGPRESSRDSNDERDDFSTEGSEDEAFLYVNLGRRDGVRPGEIIGLLVDECGVDKAEVGRIRIRDRHTFVGIPRDRVDDIVEQLAGKESHDKELVVELARAQP